ncbi:MAG: carboxypeptidase regulatory-like domain-containing protein [Nitrospira sp.]|nr:carboxypeptidase regulatory-like domain-containing protein [Nitrospira sp.]
MNSFLKIIPVLLLSAVFFPTDCIAIRKPADTIERLNGHVSDESSSPVSNVNVTIFDGFTLKEVKTDSNGEYSISALPVSKNNYMVVFFTKKGFIPVVYNIMSEKAKTIEYSPVMKRMSAQDKGFIIGSVYHPVRGGKLQFNNGIKGFGKNTNIVLEGNGKTITKETDSNGHFLFEISPGRYALSKGGVRERPEIDLSAGETVIKNIRSGFTLID